MAIDFTVQRMKHRGWKSVIRSYLEFGVSIPKDRSIEPYDCDLGKWIKASKKKYAAIKEMDELEKVHISLHNRVKRIIQLKGENNLNEARQEFTKVETESDKIVDLLTSIEKKI